MSDTTGKLMRSHFLVEIKHTKPIAGLASVVENRISTLDGVSGIGTVTAQAISQDAGWAALAHDRGMGHG
jgi:hypothetical protein